MDWYSRSKRGSLSSTTGSVSAPGIPGGVSYSPKGYNQPTSTPNLGRGGNTTPTFTSPLQRSNFYSNYHPLLPPSSSLSSGTSGGGSSSNNQSPISGQNVGGNNTINSGNQMVFDNGINDRHLYYFSQLPLNCCDWTKLEGAGGGADMDCIALSSYKEGFNNKIQVIHGVAYSNNLNDSIAIEDEAEYSNSVDGFDMYKVAEVLVDYPVTNLQWDPSMNNVNNGYNERLAASLEVLRLYKVEHENYDANNNFQLTQTHILANNSTSQSTKNGDKNGSTEDINTFPPVTSFDWNKVDPRILITSSVDTTCTVWDLTRSSSRNTSDGKMDIAQVKTQLIAHDLEVFDVKFIHDSTNIFASVGNDGSMRVFDLRSLEHSTIIYEPTTNSSTNLSAGGGHYNSNALIRLSTSNVDSHYLATIGVNLNQVIVIDMRMPGIPVVTLDGSLGGMNNAAINSIKWHPLSNHLLTGGDDCQALVWDCTTLSKSPNTDSATTTPANPNDVGKLKNGELGMVIDCPVLSYEEELEVNNVCWRRNAGDWMGVVSGKGFQAVLI